ncbi:acetyl-CoA carboxylase biotin carboxyl carrier protein subunit [bacterium]|jgi:biotin carboxyl carrier protein|nr:acetyl-CoA carboxylase biotin carboxyl carrier protein subunit [bacterium]
MIEGSVGKAKFVFLTNPKGRSGQTEVRLPDGRIEKVRWIRDDQGIWIETGRGFTGFDVRKFEVDDAVPEYQLLRRRHAEVLTGVSFLKAGEESSSSASGKAKKGAKVKSQMPGKIVRILVSPGGEVQKGQPLLVMEAMKMENEIKSPQDGVVQAIKVTEGQAIETGAELLVFV